jgi:ribonuclease BN (tRNA processing enzyme)
MPANGQASSGYLVAADTATLLLDCGPGVATALGAVTAPDQLSAVIVTHLHLDHCYDLLPVGKSLLGRGVRYPRAGEADAAHVAQAAGVKTLVLTHFPSTDTQWLLARRDEAARAFTGTIHLARPGMAFEVG